MISAVFAMLNGIINKIPITRGLLFLKMGVRAKSPVVTAKSAREIIRKLCLFVLSINKPKGIEKSREMIVITVKIIKTSPLCSDKPNPINSPLEGLFSCVKNIRRNGI